MRANTRLGPTALMLSATTGGIAGWRRDPFGMFALRDSGHRIHCEEEWILPVAEPEARPAPRVRRESEAAVEGAGAATGTGGEVMKMVEPVEVRLPSHPHILSRRDLSAR